MFSLFKKKPAVDASWNVVGSDRFTFVIFGDDTLESSVRPALAALHADLEKASEANEAFAAEPESIALKAELKALSSIATPDGDDDDDDDDDHDLEGDLADWISSNVTVVPVAIDDARARVKERLVLTPGFETDPATPIERATHAFEVRAAATALLDWLAPFGLLSVAAALVRTADAVAYDTIGMRVVPKASIAEPLAGLGYRSVGVHARILIAKTPSETLDFTTIGLEKYGLFDLQLSGVPEALSGARALVAATAQSLVGARPAAPGPWKPEPLLISNSDVLFFDNAPFEKGSNKFARVAFRPIATSPTFFELTTLQGGTLDARGIRDALRKMNAPERLA
jgi:hypothetical protein